MHSEGFCGAPGGCQDFTTAINKNPQTLERLGVDVNRTEAGWFCYSGICISPRFLAASSRLGASLKVLI